jgi:hypothetical protein
MVMISPLLEEPCRIFFKESREDSVPGCRRSSSPM